MSITVQHCPLCSSTQSVLFDQRNLHGQQITNRLCRSCGLIYQSPRMSDSELEDFYTESYRQLYQGSQGPNAKDLAVQQQRARSLLSFSKDQLRKVDRHLDIGSSAGLLLQSFRSHYNSQPVGVEPGDAYRQYAQEQGLSVYRNLNELTEAANSFDLISLAHVLEHMPDPVESLSELHQQWLAPGGYLLIEVPNLYGHDCFEVAHPVSYSPHTLEQTLLQAGYEVITIKIHGQPRSLRIPLYITVLAQSRLPSPAYGMEKPETSVKPNAKESKVVPEHGVRRKRRLAMLRRRAITRLLPGQAWLPVNASQAPEASNQK